MTTSDLTETTALVAQPFDLKLSEAPESEALLLSVLSERIAEMLEIEPEFLMSLLYRLDVLEKRILPVLAPDARNLPTSGWRAWSLNDKNNV